MRTLYYQFGKNSQRLMHGDIAVLDTGDVGMERLEVDGPITVQLVAEACGDDVREKHSDGNEKVCLFDAGLCSLTTRSTNVGAREVRDGFVEQAFAKQHCSMWEIPPIDQIEKGCPRVKAVG